MNHKQGEVRKSLDDSSDRMAEFLELYSAHYPRLQFFIAALLPTANDAADVLQETSMVLWRKFDGFELGTNFYAWACKIARFQVMKYREQRAKLAHLFETNLLEKLADEASDETLVHGVTLQTLESCLNKLSERDRILIRRRYQPGATVQALSLDIGRSANSLSKSLGRIRRTLLECIDRALVHEARE